METKSKSNLSNKEQNQLSKFGNDETTIIKPEDKGGAVVAFSTGHYQNMIMQDLLDENAYKKLDSCIDNKVQINFLRLLRQYKMCFTEPEWKFLTENHYTFYALPKIHKSVVIESTINTQNSEVLEIFETNDLKLRPIVTGPKCSTRKLSQLIDILLKPFLKHIKNFIRDSLDFLIKCSRNVDEH